MSFAEATSVARLSDGTYAGEIHAGWDIFGVSNGGYVMAIAARAMADMARGRDLVSVSGHFTNPGSPGPITIELTEVKVGRAISTLRADVIKDDKILLAATGSFADADREINPVEWVQGAPPELPPIDQCLRAVPNPDAPLPPPFMGKVAVALHPDDVTAFDGGTGVAQMRGWFRLLEDEQPDALATVVAADAFPPAVFNANLPLQWTPTLDLTVHVRDPRPRSWMRCVFNTRFVSGGMLEEDSEIWDEDGKLVAQSRQLALVPR